MVSELAKGDYEDLIRDGLSPTLEDFDRLNQLALRLTDGAETTPANFPRIGWAGDIPFYQPTCAAFAWYLEFADRDSFAPATKDACWFYALAHARIDGAFRDLTDPRTITDTVNRWLSSLPVTRDEISRACRFASVGFDDAAPGQTDAQRAAEPKTDTAKRESSLSNLSENLSVAAALTGIPPSSLAAETPSRLKRMIDAVRDANPIGSNSRDAEHSRLTADYQLAFREIRQRLASER